MLLPLADMSLPIWGVTVSLSALSQASAAPIFTQCLTMQSYLTCCVWESQALACKADKRRSQPPPSHQPITPIPPMLASLLRCINRPMAGLTKSKEKREMVQNIYPTSISRQHPAPPHQMLYAPSTSIFAKKLVDFVLLLVFMFTLFGLLITIVRTSHTPLP